MVTPENSWLKPALDLQKSIVEQTSRSYRTALTVTRELQAKVTDIAQKQLDTQFQIPRVELKLLQNTARRLMLRMPCNTATQLGRSSEDPADTAPGSARELEDINGIGPSYAKKLRAAGIKDSTDLAACSPSEITDVLDTGLVNEEKASGWIEDAASR